VARGTHTFEDGGGRLPVQLLENNGAGHGLEAGLAVVHLERSDSLNNASHDGIGLLQVTYGLLHCSLCLS
jgi:hypothetical protein